MSGRPAYPASEICCAEWPRAGKLNEGAGGSAAGPAGAAEPELARAMPASEPATHRTAKPARSLCLTADRHTSPIAPAQVCWLTPGFTPPSAALTSWLACQCVIRRLSARGRGRRQRERRGRRGQQHIELAALVRAAADQDVAAVGPGHGADQGQP